MASGKGKGKGKGKEPAMPVNSTDQTGEVMEQALPILPMGFVENTAEVYREVASFDVIPPEKLREYWRVYTITHKKLYDPTANRLENFWWHVWGSKRRDLSGRTVARLYQEISSGPTFVPLRTPASRYDGPTIPNFSNASRPELTPEPATEDNDNEADEAVENLIEPQAQRQVPASSSRPPPAHSILKKPRPSQSGLRPTPHFDLPSGNATVNKAAETAAANDTCAIEEDSGFIVSASDDATASSTGSGSGSTSKSKGKGKSSRQTASTPPTQSTSASSSKTVTPKQDAKKPVKVKSAKKKFVISAASGSKKRPLVSRRPVSVSSQTAQVTHKPQSSVVSEPGSRLAGPSKSSRQSPTTQIVEEDDLDDELLPIDNMSASVSPANDRSLGKSSQAYQQPLQAYQQSFVQSNTYRSSPLSDKARPSYSSQMSTQMERTTSQASESTVVSSMSGSTVASGTADTAPGIVPGAVLSASPMVMSGSVHPPARRESAQSQASGSIVSSVGSSILDMPTKSNRNFPVAQRPSPSSGSLVRPGGGLIRQTTMPYERGAVPRQQIIRAGSTISLAPLRSPIRTTAPSSAFMSQITAAAPATNATTATTPQIYAAPLMGRSISQDSYGSRPRPFKSQPSPKLDPMRSATIAAPSMIAVSGQFMDPEGPDTFSFYAKTGLDDQDEEEEKEDPELSSSFKGDRSNSFSGSFGNNNSSTPQAGTQRTLYTPTRPTQTPRIPFARTRSQLNVILDREKERLGKGNYNSWNESRGSNQDAQRRGS